MHLLFWGRWRGYSCPACQGQGRGLGRVAGLCKPCCWPQTAGATWLPWTPLGAARPCASCLQGVTLDLILIQTSRACRAPPGRALRPELMPERGAWGQGDLRRSLRSACWAERRRAALRAALTACWC